MIVKEDATVLIRAALDNRIPMIVLRGIDEFANTEGDIDILVPRNFANDAMRLVSELAYKENWSVVDVSYIGYISQLCLARKSTQSNRYESIKVDIWNGVSWAAIGKDPFGDAIFKIFEKNGEIEAAALATTLQKFMYAGFFRQRDKKRIFAVYDITRIVQFCVENGIPLTSKDLQNGRLSSIKRWKLRSTSAGVVLNNLAAWAAFAVWRILWFRVFRSKFEGRFIIVLNGSNSRRLSLLDAFQSIVKETGFHSPIMFPYFLEREKSLIKRRYSKIKTYISIWMISLFRLYRGETILVDGIFVPKGLALTSNCSNTFLRKFSSWLFSHAIFVELSPISYNNLSKMVAPKQCTRFFSGETFYGSHRAGPILSLSENIVSNKDTSDVDLDFMISNIREYFHTLLMEGRL